MTRPDHPISVHERSLLFLLRFFGFMSLMAIYAVGVITGLVALMLGFLVWALRDRPGEHDGR